MKLKVGDHVRTILEGEYYYGEITIVGASDMGYKVLFDNPDGPNYDYYKENELELITEEDIKE